MYGDRQEQALGVYAIDERGELTLLHEYQDDDYSLEDILEEFGFGRAEGDTEDGVPIVALNAEEISELKINADAYSFDYDEGFIEMCLDIERFATGTSEQAVRLISID